MNPYNFSLLLFAFGSFFVGLLVAFKRQDTIGRIYFLFSTVTSAWGIGFAVMLNQQISYNFALFSARFADGIAVFIPAIWLHLALLMSSRYQSRKIIVFALYMLSFVFSCFMFTPFFVSKVKPVLNFKYWPHPGFLFHFFTIMFFIVVPYSFIQLYSKIKNSSGDEQVQLKGFFIAVLFGYMGGTISFALNYDLPIPQYAIFLMPVYPFITAYFMIRHRLFDIEEVAQVFQKEKLATIGLLAASINHEIKNPLYAVKGLLETYVENEESGVQSKAPLEVSKKALAQVSRALDVITKLNRFAKPSNDQETRDKGQGSGANIHEAIQNVSGLVSYEFELDKIKILNHVSSTLPAIQADQHQLEEILFNLIVNACHAMKEKGGTLEIRSQMSNNGIQLEISDTGTGISPDQAKHLFEPFHTTKGENGTGLGLYITKQLVERNSGKISVKSEDKKGTSFVLEFKSNESV